MEFDFNINLLLGDVISKLDNRVMPQRHPNNSIMRELRRNLLLVIDKMGEASSKAQGLYTIITGGRKLELSEHLLYIMKDAGANNGKGAVIGILKVGHKKLFVYDKNGVQHEMQPHCVLDFYVHESRQRMGCGKQLFEFMLKDRNVNPLHLAVDKPSHKFLSFLAKHYNLRTEIPQMNNFVVYDGFFSQKLGMNNNQNASGKPPMYRTNEDPYSSKTSYVPGYSKNGSQSSGKLSRPLSGNVIHQSAGKPSRPLSRNRSISVIDGYRDEDNAIKNLMISPVPTMLAQKTTGLGYDKQNVPNGYDQQTADAVYNRYSRHGATPSPPPTLQLPRTLRKQNSRDKLPPLVRDNPPESYYNMLNMHQDYQGRGGHLKVLQNTPSPSIPREPPSQPVIPTGVYRGYSAPPVVYNPYTNADTAWTVFGVVPNHRTIASKHNAHNRLW
ncbi:alpha-tubulin N-acetyltransferase-like [Gigantopelta aegis]|uniref:alpha-tubulin N-acetyltransferase-like n=1 Tax=Gigantopelta aegis TaxID=1735272 RepID=UPI001B88D7F6|nr:alpha-tubulin N-acetyltransferase-like [Gigantopelta aegis]